MCTAATYKTKDFYFGRTLDYDFSYVEEVAVTPRKFPLSFGASGIMDKHYAIIGMAYVAGNYPLYYDAVNEKGLCMAALNFVGNAVYGESAPARDNIAQFEFIPWILGQCDSVDRAREKLKRISITNTPFSPELPVAQLHWLIADRNEAITVEAVSDGIKIYDNPVGVLTNNPPFNEQLFRLNDYMRLSPKNPQNLFSQRLSLNAYSRGMGAIGLPGDWSSGSRFVRAAFTKMNSVSGDSERESVGQFFHIMATVEQPRGCCEVGEGRFEATVYTSCCNADKGIYYYTTYNNRQISAVDMHRVGLDEATLMRYPIISDEQIKMQN